MTDNYPACNVREAAEEWEKLYDVASSMQRFSVLNAVAARKYADAAIAVAVAAARGPDSTAADFARAEAEAADEFARLADDAMRQADAYREALRATCHAARVAAMRASRGEDAMGTGRGGPG